MARFLFATWEGGGHVQPMLLVAQGLIARGHQALAISDAVNIADARAAGVPFRPWKEAPSRADRSPDSDTVRDYLARTPLEMIQRLCRQLIAGPAAFYAADTIEAIETFGPDVVICHELMFGVMAAAEAKATRLAVFASNVWSLPTLEAAPPFGGGLPPPSTDFDFDLYARVRAATRTAFQCGLPDLNAARATIGLAPIADLFDQLNPAGRILLATSRAFDFDQSPPEPFRYIGPYLADPEWTTPWSPPWPTDERRPLALVSFSTMYQGQELVLRRVIEAFDGLAARAVVTLGPVLDPADYPAPDNVAVVGRAPHASILPISRFAVTHAGHASALRPLMAGLPLVCLPLGRDQPDNAARIVERGAGLRLAPDAPAEDIRVAIQTLIAEPRFRESADALGARIRADAAARSAEPELIAFAQEKR
jgi:MGT family glycosyltransferase